jgi:hypothetical protein
MHRVALTVVAKENKERRNKNTTQKSFMPNDDGRKNYALCTFSETPTPTHWRGGHMLNLQIENI